jgi:aromatic-amino-acid transaminase
MTSVFSQLKRQPADPLLRLITEFRQDPRAGKIDLGVGVYRDETGNTPVMRAVKAAEHRLFEQQTSKAYLGPEGNLGFAAALKSLVTGNDEHYTCVQTPGGTGALRLAMDVIARAKPGAAVWVGMPTWPNHTALLKATGLQVRPYRYLTRASVDFSAMIAALQTAAPGDIVLLHGCCHNPSGIDLAPAEWAALAALLQERKLLPLIDLAYQGLGSGFADDACPALQLLEHCSEGFLAYSCDKNFALYRERVGALFTRARDPDTAETVFSNALTAARTNWSMPPDHGAALVQIILDDNTLRTDWQAELDTMRNRIDGLRQAVAAAAPNLDFLAQQKGLFSLLPISPDAVAQLKTRYGIYMAASGRINVAGFTLEAIPEFVEAYNDVATLGPVTKTA